MSISVDEAVTPASIPAMVAATVAVHGDRTAVIDGDVELSYAELSARARAFAAALVADGVATR